jgi:hypothetical protein
VKSESQSGSIGSTMGMLQNLRENGGVKMPKKILPQKPHAFS